MLFARVLPQLEDVSWRLHLQMANSGQAKMKEPVALFELGVRDDSTGVRVLRLASDSSQY